MDELPYSTQYFEANKKNDAKDPRNKDSEVSSTAEPRVNQEKDNVNSTNRVNDVSSTANAANNEVNAVEADLNNMESTFQVSPIPITRIHKDHPLEQVIEDLQSAPQTRTMSKNLEGYGLDFVVYQMDVKSAFLYGKIKEEKEDGIFISQDKYVNEILNNFGFSDVKTASTPMETHKNLLKDEKGKDVDENLYRSMIGSLMYLTSSRPDIMFAYARSRLWLLIPQQRLIKNLVFHSKTKHIEIRHHFIRDSNEKKLIQMIKIHTKKNVADLLTKAFNLKVNAVRYKLTTVGFKLMLLPTKSAGFEQIIDFLNAHPIKYALTINPTIYTSCVEQFWTTAKAKNINEEAHIHAKVDEKKVVISEASIRKDLWFGDEGGIDCLPNETIFEQLSLMGAKISAWNEFSNTITSAFICLATDQKFKFSKYIFDSMVKNLDSATKFLMFSRLKKYQEKDKIGSKSNKNGKRDEAEKSQKQLQ
nr:hypothetical protein [Tanacetum cinerariifolium]